MTSNEVIVTNLNQRDGMPPVPSTCNDIAGGVVRPMPSNIVIPCVVSTLVRDMSSTALATSARDMPPRSVCVCYN